LIEREKLEGNVDAAQGAGRGKEDGHIKHQSRQPKFLGGKIFLVGEKVENVDRPNEKAGIDKQRRV
jgi:hypothetical protein